MHFSYEHINKLLFALTVLGKTNSRAIPMSLPQAAPVNRDGMNIPADTLSPYVQIERPR